MKMLWAGATQIVRRLKRAIARDDGAASIEFVLLFPAIMTLFLTAFEVSVYLVRSMMLERALDLSVRTLRLGDLDPATSDELRQRVCDDALIFADCYNSMMIELTRVPTDTWTLPASNVTCVERDEEIQPVVDFNLGSANDVMIVRACAVLDPFFGTTPLVLELPKDASGGVQIIASSTFVNEP
jgi:Flp pilus assembly protein TadG